MTIKEKEDEICADFELFDDWMDRYEHIISLGKDVPRIDPAQMTEANLIKGCQSRVWLVAESDHGKVYYRADSDAIITRGLVALCINVLSGQPAEDIVKAELTFVDRIGLKQHLSPTRANGLVSMLNQMKRYAAQQLASNA